MFSETTRYATNTNKLDAMRKTTPIRPLKETACLFILESTTSSPLANVEIF